MVLILQLIFLSFSVEPFGSDVRVHICLSRLNYSTGHLACLPLLSPKTSKYQGRKTGTWPVRPEYIDACLTITLTVVSYRVFLHAQFKSLKPNHPYFE